VRRRAKVDEKHPEIVQALRGSGYKVLSLARVGGGCPDLLVGKGTRILLMEVKAPPGPRGGASAKGQKLNAAQEKFREEWAPMVRVVRSAEDALREALFFL
jgi:hypothetical protein